MWAGDDRHFVSWYLNLQEPFRRTEIGYDTEDHELDVIVLEGGQWFFKDEEKVELRVQEGRYSAAKAEVIRALGTQIGDMLDRGEAWWDPELKSWRPDASWTAPPAVAPGWERVPWEDWREPEGR